MSTSRSYYQLKVEKSRGFLRHNGFPKRLAALSIMRPGFLHIQLLEIGNFSPGIGYKGASMGVMFTKF